MGKPEGHESPNSKPQNFQNPLGGSASSSIGELIAKVTAQFSFLVRDEIKFASLQAKAKVTKLGTGGALFAVAGVLALYMFGILLLAAGFGFSTFLPTWLAFLCVAGILFVIILLLALFGVFKLKASKKHKVDPKAGMLKNLDAVKKGIKK